MNKHKPKLHRAREAPVQETAAPTRTPTTDEELLDQALGETFPASDPISPGSGVRTPGLLSPLRKAAAAKQ